MTSKELVKVDDDNNTKSINKDLEDVEYFYEKLKEIYDKMPIPNAWKKPYSWEDKKGE